jgi:dihydropteroate synthase
MVEAGAAVIDVGGESTRPGAQPVSVQEELDRVLPVIAALVAELPVPISVDTSKPEVMTAAVAAGAGLINDVFALQQAGALEAAAALGVPVCLMHMLGTPQTMQADPQYRDVVAEVRDFLLRRAVISERAGIPRDRILIDPGFGFGKTLEHNCRLLRELRTLVSTEYPVLVGLSRKSMIGRILDRPVDRRLYGSLASAVIAVWQGALVVRTHDVTATVDAIMTADAISRLR